VQQLIKGVVDSFFFNNINSVARQQINELMVLKLVKTYCLPRLLYGCEILPLETTHIHELDVI